MSDELERAGELLEEPAATLTRSAAILEHDTGARTLTVQLCRWDEPRRVRDPFTAPYLETHARGSLVPADRLAVYDEHLGELIGHMDPPADAGPGPVSRLHIAHTRAGDDVLALIDAGTLNDVSMEFIPAAAGEVWTANRDAVTRTRSTLTACAFAFRPTHTAPILQRESETPAMPDTDTAPAPAEAELVPAAPPAMPAAPAGLDAVQAELVAMRGELARAGGARPAAGGTRFGGLEELMRAALSPHLESDLVRHLDPLGGGLVLGRAWTDTTSADVPGLMPAQRLSQIYSVISAAQPLVDAAGSMPPPASLTITYPKVTQRPLVAEQSGGEKTLIASREIGITDATAPVRTYAGGTDVSAQVLFLSSPGYLEIAGQLYAEEMARAVDSAAYVQYAASATHKVSIGAAATGWNAALFNLAALIASTSRRFPNRLIVSPDLWAKLGGAADTSGRPLFTGTSASNPLGSATLTSPEGDVRGLTYVVDPNFPADRGVMFNDQAFQTSLGPVQTMAVDVPRLVGRDMAVYRFAAFAAVDPGGMGIFATGTAPTADEEAFDRNAEAEGTPKSSRSSSK